MYGIFTYIYHKKTTKCRWIYHTWILWEYIFFVFLYKRKGSTECFFSIIMNFRGLSLFNFWEVFSLQTPRLRNRKWHLGYLGVSKNRGIPKWWFIMENPMKMDDLGVPLFSETSIWNWLLFWGGILLRSLELTELNALWPMFFLAMCALRILIGTRWAPYQ